MQPLTGWPRQLYLFLVLLPLTPAAHSQLVITEGTNISVDISRTDGRIAMDLLGRLWIVPRNGGNAVRTGDDVAPARNPRWSPDGQKILYQSITPRQSEIRLLDLRDGTSEALVDTQFFDQHAAWHPGGERIVFSSERGDSGFDLWEMDLASRLTWRLTSLPGDETEAAWSANGRHLAYIHRDSGQWSLMLRRFGQPDETMYASPVPIFAPSWRPDGSLLTWLQESPDGIVVQMMILSDPPLVRPFLSREDFFLSPLSWSDRGHFIYTADGAIKSRRFDDWHSSRIRFAAPIDTQDRSGSAMDGRRQLAVTSAPNDRMVLRAARIFDGSAYDYRYGADVLIEDGRISEIVAQRSWPDTVVLDLGEATLLPGFVDSYAALPDGDAASVGAMLLSWGVTTIVSPDRPELDPAVWESEQSPGPRLLRVIPVTASPTATERPLLVTLLNGAGDLAGIRAWQALGVPVLAENWTTGLALGADLLIGVDSLPTSPRGLHYQDMAVIAGAGPITLVSGLADVATPGLAGLLDTRQAVQAGRYPVAVRRYSGTSDLSGRTSSVIVGSLPNRLPPGLALHAEFLALHAAGLSGDQVLKAGGLNAATALRLPGEIGIVAPGALADLVLVNGDPLNRPADAANIIAVVRNGRFFSLGGLLERQTAAPTVDNLDKSAESALDAQRK